MAFRDFTYEEAVQKLGLTLEERVAFSSVQPIEISPDFTERMRIGGIMSSLSTEKAKSEFIIAPILLEVWRLVGGKFGVFSGIEFNVDSSRGLNGFCDFLLTRSPLQSMFKAPVVAVVEAKNDNVRNGLGQCVAAMVAARDFNANATPPSNETIFGVVTTGSLWRFLRLDGTTLVADLREYGIGELGYIMGILAHILAEPN